MRDFKFIGYPFPSCCWQPTDLKELADTTLTHALKYWKKKKVAEFHIVLDLITSFSWLHPYMLRIEVIQRRLVLLCTGNHAASFIIETRLKRADIISKWCLIQTLEYVVVGISSAIEKIDKIVLYHMYMVE